MSLWTKQLPVEPGFYWTYDTTTNKINMSMLTKYVTTASQSYHKIYEDLFETNLYCEECGQCIPGDISFIEDNGDCRRHNDDEKYLFSTRIEKPAKPAKEQ